MTGQTIAGEIFTRIKYVSPSFYGVGSFSSTQKRKHLGLIILNQVDQLSNYVLRPLEHQKKRAQGFKRKKKKALVFSYEFTGLLLCTFHSYHLNSRIHSDLVTNSETGVEGTTDLKI